jgi:hypothetical protein
VKSFVAIAAVVSLFFVGVVVGALGTHLFYAKQLRQAAAPPEAFVRGFEMQLERALDLTPDQMTSIREILREGHLESERLREELRPRVRAHMERMHARIDEVLSPEQRERFEEFRERQGRRADMFFLGPGHGPGHGPPPGRGPGRRWN